MIKSRMLIFIVTTLSVTACAPGNKTATASLSSYNITYQGRENTAELPDDWAGHYTYSGELPGAGYADVNLLVFQEEAVWYGYLHIDGFRYITEGGKAVYTSWEDRILTEIRGGRDQAEIYFTENLSAETGSGGMSGVYENGQRLFALVRDGEEIRPVWDAMSLEQSRTDCDAGFVRSDRGTALQLADDRDREVFLQANGFSAGEALFYEYHDTDGALGLEVYYDTARARGVGIFHGKSEERRVMSSFEVDGWENAAWHGDKFAVDNRGEDGSGLDGYEAEYTYNEEEWLTGFRSNAIISGSGGAGREDIIRVEFTYREDGTLEQKNCWYNPQLFGTARHRENHRYDSGERLVYTSAYHTHGYMEDYYLYPDGGDTPSWRLTLDHAGWGVAAEELIRYE